MRRFYKKMALAALVLLAVLILAACGQQAAGPVDEKAKEPDYQQWTDQQLLDFAAEADKRLVTAIFNQNPDRLREMGLTPANIKTREDLDRLIGQHWDQKVIDELWREGYHLGDQWGFGMEYERPLLFLPDDPSFPLKEVRIVSRTPQQAVVEVRYLAYLDPDKPEEKVEITGEHFRLVLTENGWRATFVEL